MTAKLCREVLPPPPPPPRREFFRPGRVVAPVVPGRELRCRHCGVDITVPAWLVAFAARHASDTLHRRGLWQAISAGGHDHGHNHAPVAQLDLAI